MKWWRIVFGSLVFAASFFWVSAVSADSTYTVKFGDTLWGIARLYNLTPNQIAAVNPAIVDLNLIYGGQVLVIPGAAQPTGTPGQGAAVPGTHRVVAGENLFRLSLRYNTTVEDIVAANPTKIINPHWIYVGDVLTIPGGQGGNPQETTTTPLVNAGGNYVVRPGDGLTGIARRFGTDVDTLLSLNPEIENRDLIFVGDIIRLPG